MPVLGASSHGESGLRLLRIVRRGDRHDPRDFTVGIRLEGDFAPAFVDGAADTVIPGATLTSAVHRVARAHAGREIEEFAHALAAHVVESHRQVSRVRVDVSERAWLRLDVGGKAQGQAFVLGGPELRTVAVTSNGRQTAVVAGLDHLTLMRSAGFLSRPAAAPPDDGSEDSVQPLLVGSLSAKWTYSNADVTFGPYRQGVRAAIIETFALHAARRLQHTLYAIADVVLATYEEILDVSLAMQEHPYRPADPFPADLGGRDDLYTTTEAPVGVVEVTVERDRSRG